MEPCTPGDTYMSYNNWFICYFYFHHVCIYPPGPDEWWSCSSQGALNWSCYQTPSSPEFSINSTAYNRMEYFHCTRKYCMASVNFNFKADCQTAFCNSTLFFLPSWERRWVQRALLKLGRVSLCWSSRHTSLDYHPWGQTPTALQWRSCKRETQWQLPGQPIHRDSCCKRSRWSCYCHISQIGECIHFASFPDPILPDFQCYTLTDEVRELGGGGMTLG